MKDTPILYTGPMVRSVLADRKNMTRRVVKPQFSQDAIPAEVSATTPEGWQTTGHSGLWWDDVAACMDDAIRCPYGMPGDRLWVKETFYAWGHWETRFSEAKGRDEWHFVDMTLDTGRAYRYAADGAIENEKPKRGLTGNTPTWWKRPAIFMRRAASRITLEVTGVRIERLQAISQNDAVNEGLQRLPASGRYVVTNGDQYFGFASTNPVEVYRDLWEGINGAGSWDANPWVWVIAFKLIKGEAA
ncbi:MAG: hypothetical protein K2W33_14670 [Burkholderiales bacterium]|nr:hypothetical protein [Burkholderiales bacterium]